MHCYRAFDKIKPQSKAWIESSEFKAKYLDTNHTYPPLLNPDSIDYESIPAEFAWELNLPLPKNYHFVYFTNGSQASSTTIQYFKECGVRIKGGDSAKQVYCGYFTLLLNVKTQGRDCIYFYANYMTDIILQAHSDAEKLLYLFFLKNALYLYCKGSYCAFKRLFESY